MGIGATQAWNHTFLIDHLTVSFSRGKKENHCHHSGKLYDVRKNTEMSLTLQQEKKCHARHNCLVFLSMKGHSKPLKISHQQSVMPKWRHMSCLTFLRQKVACLKAVDGQLHRSISHLFSTDWEDCDAPAALTGNVDYPSSSLSQWNKIDEMMKWNMTGRQIS